MSEAKQRFLELMQFASMTISETVGGMVQDVDPAQRTESARSLVGSLLRIGFSGQKAGIAFMKIGLIYGKTPDVSLDDKTETFTLVNLESYEMLEATEVDDTVEVVVRFTVKFDANFKPSQVTAAKSNGLILPERS